jgi:prevent-host-death family protein
MKQVGVRALKQNASAVVAEAAAGEVITITDRGRPVAQLIPMPTGTLSGLVASGRARPAQRSAIDLPAPAKRRRGQRPLSEVVAEGRDDERY